MSANATSPSRRTTRRDAFAKASGTSCRPTIQTIAPAAKPRPIGSTEANRSTKRKAGTATSACGKAQKTLHAAAAPTRIPRGTSTRLIASPSGTFWMAIASAIIETERSAAAERGADADPLGARVGGHDRHDENGVAGVCSTQDAHPQVVVPGRERVRRLSEQRAGQSPDRGPHGAPMNSFDHQAGAGAEHDAGCDRVARSEPSRRSGSSEHERQCSCPRRQRRGQACGEDDEGRAYRHELVASGDRCCHAVTSSLRVRGSSGRGCPLRTTLSASLAPASANTS